MELTVQCAVVLTVGKAHIQMFAKTEAYFYWCLALTEYSPQVLELRSTQYCIGLQDFV